MPYNLQQLRMEDLFGEFAIEGMASDEEEVIPFQYSITSYGADYPVESLVNRMQSGDIFIPPFQRGYVWNIVDASRFVETLLLGLPVPGIFLSKEYESQKMLVIDGQQRLRTLEYFYNGIFEPDRVPFRLKGVQENFEGATYDILTEQDRRRLDDAIIHLTIIKQDEPSDDDSSIYYIFERLNTTGRILEAQEIRACLFHGEFNSLLDELNQDQNWRKIFGQEEHPRMRDQELILRFFALFFQRRFYRKPMKVFLNRYMKHNRDLTLETAEQLSNVFKPTIEVVNQSIGSRAFRPIKALNAAVFDSVMIGIASRLAKGPINDSSSLANCYENLLNNENFLRTIQGSTSDEEVVKHRIQFAIDCFQEVK